MKNNAVYNNAIKQYQEIAAPWHNCLGGPVVMYGRNYVINYTELLNLYS